MAKPELVMPDYKVLKCDQCKTLQLWPQPSVQTLQKYYNLPYYTQHTDTSFSRLFMKFFREWGVKRVAFLCKLQPKGKFLDIGCGAGELLADMAEKGYEVYGTEVSPAALKAIMPTLVSRVKIGELENIHFPEAPFNLIMLSDVLEHTFNPLQTLRIVHKLLHHSGHVVVSVPNWDDPDAKVFPRQYWHNIDVPRHLWHFTSLTLPQLAERAGFKVVGTMRLGWIEWFETPLSLVHAFERLLLNAGMGPLPSRGLKWLAAPFLLLITFIIRVFGPRPRQLRLIFQKI